MSLILDALKKIKSNKVNKPVPPDIKPIEKTNKRVLILSGISIFLVVFGAVLYYFLENYPQENILAGSSDIFTSNHQTNQKIYPVNKNQNVPQNYEVSNDNIKVENKTTTSSETTNVVQKNKEENPLPPLDQVLKEIEREVNNENIEPKKEVSNITTNHTHDLTVDKTKISAYLSLSEKYLNEGKLNLSYEYLKKAYTLDKENLNILNNLIVLSFQIGKIDEGLKLISDNTPVEVVSSAVVELINQERYDKAEILLNKFKDKDKNGEIYYGIGLLKESLGNYPESLYYYEKAYWKNPSDPYISYSYGRILEINGHNRKAFKIYKKILNLNFNDKRLFKIVKNRLNLLKTNFIRTDGEM